MKCLIIGSNGMAGHVITKILQASGIQVTTLARKNADIELDLRDTIGLSELVKRWSVFDYVINCAGLLVDASNQSLNEALLINAYVPKLLEASLASTQTKIIHISTNCVFSGLATEPYLPCALKDETNNYGITKSIGEICNQKDVTFRTTIIGPEMKKNGSGLLHWFLREESPTISGWNNHYWNGITTIELASAILSQIREPRAIGIYNLVNNDFSCSKYDLLVSLKQVFSKKIEIVPVKNGIDKNKVLYDNSDTPLFVIKDFKEQLEVMKDFIVESNYEYGAVK